MVMSIGKCKIPCVAALIPCKWCSRAVYGASFLPTAAIQAGSKMRCNGSKIITQFDMNGFVDEF